MRSTPNPYQYLTYCYGRRLPEAMADWVRRDLAGRGAMRRTFIRVMVPAIVVVAPLWLLPASPAMRAAMTFLLLTPCVYFTHALDLVWRRYRLAQHGLSPDFADALARERAAPAREAYERRYRPRPAAADDDGDAPLSGT